LAVLLVQGQDLIDGSRFSLAEGTLPNEIGILADEVEGEHP
jgi:hypothetical protein